MDANGENGRCSSVARCAVAEFDLLLARERLILSATEQIIARMDEAHVSRTELADWLGVNKSNVTQRLNGSRNLTLGTLADMAHALGCRFTISLRVGTEGTALDYANEYRGRAR